MIGVFQVPVHGVVSPCFAVSRTSSRGAFAREFSACHLRAAPLTGTYSGAASFWTAPWRIACCALVAVGARRLATSPRPCPFRRIVPHAIAAVRRAVPAERPPSEWVHREREAPAEQRESSRGPKTGRVVRPIPRISAKDLSVDEFRRNFDCRTPIFLTDALPRYKADLWIAVLNQMLGDEFLEWISAGNHVDERKKSSEAFLESTGDAGKILLAMATPSEHFARDYFDFFPHTMRPNRASIYMGSPGSRCDLHHDVFDWTGWSALMVGAKHWTFLPPDTEGLDENHGSRHPFDFHGTLPRIALGGGGTSPIDLFGELSPDGSVGVDRTAHPDFDFPAERWEGTQLPGDIVLIPSRWWHQTYYWETCFSVASQYFNEVNIDGVLDHILDWSETDKSWLPNAWPSLPHHERVESALLAVLKNAYGEGVGEKVWATICIEDEPSGWEGLGALRRRPFGPEDVLMFVRGFLAHPEGVTKPAVEKLLDWLPAIERFGLRCILRPGAGEGDRVSIVRTYSLLERVQGGGFQLENESYGRVQFFTLLLKAAEHADVVLMAAGKPSTKVCDRVRQELSMLGGLDGLELLQFDLVGSWTNWDFRPLDLVAHARGVYRSCFRLGESGIETFQVVVDRDWQAVLHPGGPDMPCGQGLVVGPDAGGHGLNWAIRGRPGDEVELTLDITKEDSRQLVMWRTLHNAPVPSLESAAARTIVAES